MKMRVLSLIFLPALICACGDEKELQNVKSSLTTNDDVIVTSQQTRNNLNETIQRARTILDDTDEGNNYTGKYLSGYTLMGRYDDISSDDLFSDDAREELDTSMQEWWDSGKEKEFEELNNGLKEIVGLTEVETDSGLLVVRVTIPSTLSEGKTQSDVDSTVKEHGYISGILNADGSITYTMSKSKHSEMVKKLKTSFQEGIPELLEDDDYSNIDHIDYNDDLTLIKIYVKETPPTIADRFIRVPLTVGLKMYWAMIGSPDNSVTYEYYDINGNRYRDAD